MELSPEEIKLNKQELVRRKTKCYICGEDAYCCLELHHIKKKLYIFDNKHSILYEINLKDGESKIIGSNEIGFVKYKNKEFKHKHN